MYNSLEIHKTITEKWKLLSCAGLFATPYSLGQNTGVGSLSFLQGIFPTQESNWGLLHCRWILYQLSYQTLTVQGKLKTFWSSLKTKTKTKTLELKYNMQNNKKTPQNRTWNSYSELWWTIEKLLKIRILFGGGKSEQKVILQPKSSNFKELRIIILKLPNYLPKKGKSNFIDIY